VDGGGLFGGTPGGGRAGGDDGGLGRAIGCCKVFGFGVGGGPLGGGAGVGPLGGGP
jgi:hypothetical protein